MDAERSDSLPDDVLAEARRSHPHVSGQGDPELCRDYRGIERAATGFGDPLPEPPRGSEELIVTMAGLRDARDLVRRRALDAGLGERADDLVLAVNEILSNSISHAHESGALSTIVLAWTRDGLPGIYGVDVVASEATLQLALDPEFSLRGRSNGAPFPSLYGWCAQPRALIGAQPRLRW